MPHTEITPELIKTCREAAAVGADTVLKAGRNFDVREKAAADLVTEVDLASQQAILQHIASQFPEHPLLAEEDDQSGSLPDGFCWVVDPIDGTTNFVHGLPYFSISVAVAFDGAPIAGCIVDPSRDEEWWAAEGQGTWHNNQRVTTSGTTQLSAALVAVSLPPVTKADSRETACMLRTVEACRAIRRMGSAALNLAYVACGRLDAYWATSLAPWDLAAGALLVQEAGGKLTNIGREDFQLENPRIIASATQPLHTAVNALVGQFA